MNKSSAFKLFDGSYKNYKYKSSKVVAWSDRYVEKKGWQAYINHCGCKLTQKVLQK